MQYMNLNLPIAVIEEKILGSLLPKVNALPIHEAEKLIKARISQFSDYGKTDQLSKYTSLSYDTCDPSTVGIAGHVGFSTGGLIGAAVTMAAAYTLNKVGAKTKASFQKPVEEIIRPVVLYISFLRACREAEAAAIEIGG